MKIEGNWITQPATQAVCRMLTSAGHQALFVGGCVRDAILKRPVTDIDIATDAAPSDVIAAAEMAAMRPIPTGIDHGTVTVIVDGIAHEVTTFRKDVATDGRRAIVAFSDDIRDDARRRDFTMNALYARPDGVLVDPLNGLQDLKERRVKFIEDPTTRIREDYLRILRFFRFFAWISPATEGPDPDGLAACAELASGLETLSRERVGSEMIKLLSAPDPAPAVASMRATGVLIQVLPGADDTALAPLVHLEHGKPADPMRRLAALGGNQAQDLLRLSNTDAKRLSVLKDEIGTMSSPSALGYRHGEQLGQDILLLRAAFSGTTLSETAQSEVSKGAQADFPITASDLMPRYEGKVLGDKLRSLERDWIESGFTKSREDLLTSL